MPELPEVETTVRDLNKIIPGRKIKDIWFDFKNNINVISSNTKIRKLGSKFFKKSILGREIKIVRRKGKNILIHFSGNKVLLIHQRLTGHLLLGKWRRENSNWKAVFKNSISEDPMNRFLHLIFWFDDGKMLALSDLRKFAKIELWDREEIENSEWFMRLGPEPLDKKFIFLRFRKRIKGKKGKIKQILMDQNVIAGIGNIYSDEILWEAKINPFRSASSLNENELRKIYNYIKIVLRKAISAKGESFSDFRRINGEKGGFDPFRKVYRREGEGCVRCRKVIKRKKIGSRSAHFCPFCQI